MQLKYENINKPSNKAWKQVADIGLYALPMLIGIVTTTPLNDTQQKWIMVGLNVLIIGFKALSKFTSDEEPV